MRKPRRLICCHCNKNCLGRQWWNREHGFGVCGDCVHLHRSEGRTSSEEQRSMWGDEGVHYNVVVDTVPKKLQCFVEG